MTMFKQTEDEIRELYADAREHREALTLRLHMEEVIAEAMKEVVREVDCGDATPSYYFDRGRRLLDAMLRVCNEKGWERISRPIMAKMEAEQTMRACINVLTARRMLEPTPWMRDLMGKVSTPPVDD